jgi:Antimicrobial peptide resistance and lipid A acylation protein PagP
MVRLVLLLCLILSPFAYAEGSNHIVINGLSKHFDVNDSAFPNGLNEKNWGLGYEYNFEKAENQTIEWLVNTGFFKDSLNGTAVYLGGGGMVKVAEINAIRLKFGVEATGFYSSEYNQGRPFVALLPIINLGTDSISVNVTVIPKVQQFIDAGVVFAQVKVKF